MFTSRAIRTSPSARAKARGLTLIELMIALGLSVVIVAALAQLFVNISRTNHEMAKTNSQIENARFAMQFIKNDVIHAGYWGALVPEFDDLSFLDKPTDYPVSVPDPCKAFASWTANDVDAMVGIPVQVYESNTVGTCSMITDREPSTDVLVVRHADTCVTTDVNCEAYDANKLYFELSNCFNEIDSGSEFYLDPNSVAPLTEADCTTAVGKRKFVQSIYYVRSWATASGDDIPTLVRSDFGVSGSVPTQLAGNALVEGIERFRVELGLDLKSETDADIDPNSPVAWLDEDVRYTATNRGDGIPEGSFVHCGSAGCTVDQLTNVAALRLYVLARAREETLGYVDTKTYFLGGTSVAASALPAGTGFKRHVFSTTVRINNISGRRETPP